MNTKADDVNKIMEYLIRGDEAPYLTDEGVTWPGADEFLDMFSLEDSSLSLLQSPLSELSLPDLTPHYPPVPPSSCSDSGLSSDPHDLTDYDQQLSPFLIQNSCSIDSSPQLSPCAENVSPAYETDLQYIGDDLNDVEEVQICQEDVQICQDVEDVEISQEVEDVEICQDVEMCEDIVCPDSPQGVVEVETTKTPVEKKIIVGNNTFQDPQTRKRRPSATPKMAIVQPKIQKTITTAPVTVTSKPHIILNQHSQKPVKVTNIQVINPQPRVFCKPSESVGHRKVIRVAPMAGNPRSILLPVTIKDMKDLRGIKIINASDLKSSPNIKLTAANLLNHTKVQEIKTERNIDVEYDSNHNGAEESMSDGSDEEDWTSRFPQQNPNIPNKKNQYPRLMLTPEERKLLAKEGIKLPASYPLTKHEERELKRIRRKIRNKISAQDSRKRKKEYVDGLEDRVKQCSEENQTLMKRIKLLQSQNQSLTNQLKRLQSALGCGAGGGKAQPATCLLVLLMSVALVALPSLREERVPAHAPAHPPAHTPASHALHRALLSATHKITSEEVVLDDGEFNMEELITFKSHSDHDYQVRKLSPPALLPPGYKDIPIDEDWPPSLKSKIKFDFGDGPDYLPLIKNDNYQNFKELKIDLNVEGKPFVMMEHGKDLGIGVIKNDMERVKRENATVVRSVVVNGTRANM